MAFGVAQETGISKAPAGAAAYPDAPASNSQISGLGAGTMVPMKELFQPISATDVWPAVDGTNGPLKANTPITNTAPSFTGLTFIPWNKLGAFNKQSQNWLPVPTSNGVTSNYCCQNTTTIRSPNYASTGLDFPCWLDTWFTADTAKIIVEYQMTTTHALYLNVATPNHEVMLCRELQGKMKRITQMPKVWTNAQGGGNTKFWASYEFSQSTRDEFRLMMSAGCWFAGIWVDTGTVVKAGPNKPIVFNCDTDSWGEGAGNVWSFFGGNGTAAGVGFTDCSLLMANETVNLALETGMAVICSGQGGTGPFNAGPTGGSSSDAVRQDASSVGVIGFTPFMSQSRVNNWSSKFGPESGNDRFCTWFTAGGGNDRGGGFTKAAYKTQFLNGLNRIIAKQPDIPIVVRGCQSLNIQTLEATWNDALRELAVQLKANVLGFIDDIADYGGVGFGIKSGTLGPDGTHPRNVLGQFVGARDMQEMSNMMISRAYVAKTLAVKVV